MDIIFSFFFEISMSLDKTKLMASGTAALLFAGVSLPQVNNLSEQLGDAVGLDLGRMGCPTQLGVIAQGIVYTLAVGALMLWQSKAAMMDGKVWMRALKAGILYVVIANPMLYRITGTLFEKVGLKLADVEGCPTYTGIGVHALVFGAISYLLM